MTEQGKLKVGRASAGSGKTFTLTVEYISLLIENPENYQHILAVTFTNKATNEMKSRIIETLHGIASGNPDSNSYLAVLKHRFLGRKTEAQIRQNCQKAQALILHDYSRFRIETIDSFFQSIVRDLARELNLTANLRIDLNQDEALQDAVRQMIEHMKTGDQTYNAVLSYVQEKLDTEDKNWSIEKEVTSFSSNIFNEKYLQKEKEINQLNNTPDFYQNYKKKLYSQIENITELHHRNALDFLQYCNERGYDKTHFVGGARGVYGFFEKIANGNVPKSLPKSLLDDPDAAWMKDTEFNNRHMPAYQEILETEKKLRRKENTCRAILQQINQMSLLGSVDATLRRINNETNRFILADTAYKLNAIINGNDIPFIYEKTASAFKYIMIDEFQDTSELQWKNFIPLLKECIGNGCMCLIVGDVKQSIYRWRNSDWSILNSIHQNVLFRDVIADKELDEALKTNRRSDGYIVDFNNSFFQQAREDVAQKYSSEFPNSGREEDIKTAYSKVDQQIVPEKEGLGYVNIIDLTKIDDEETPDLEEGILIDDISADEKMLNEITETIRDLKENHQVKDRDITILTRNRKELKKISSRLQKAFPDANIVSEEAYQLDSSAAVNLLILAMQVVGDYHEETPESIRKPFNSFLCSTLALRYQELVCKNTDTSLQLNEYFSADQDKLSRLLPDKFFESISELQTLSLYELCTRLYQLFDLSCLDGDSPYWFCFMDQLTAYVDTQTADISSFVKYWFEELYKKAIPANSVEGIQLMTIHKSKGLEFHTVIIPFANWEMGGKPSILWCEAEKDEQLPLIPVNFSSSLQETDFQSHYATEQLKNYVDNLNLLYVAFTRASHNLIIITEQPSPNRYSVHEVIIRSIAAMKFPVGEIVSHKDEESATKTHNIRIDYQTKALDVEFWQSNRSSEFVSNAEKDSNPNASYISKGLVVHKIFETIRDEDDIPKVVRQLQQEGVFKDETFANEIKQIVHEALTNSKVHKWFDSRWKVLNESSIITTTGNETVTTKRPDRVIYDEKETIVIDYKTGKPKSSHQTQVQEYISLLTSMGMKNVHGYLWYIKENNVIEVK